MAWQTARYQLSSSAPLLMHNGRLADPLDKWSKELKKLNGKKGKTDADQEEVGRVEFLAGLYMSADGPIIPAFMIDAVVTNGAKKVKMGQISKSGVFCFSHAQLQYDGPRTADALWADERFRHRAVVRVSMAKVARTRPVFESWTAIVELNYEPTLVNVEQIDEWLRIAGAQVGIGDRRPQYGRFVAVRIP